jgi:hypothetical protein
MFGMSILVRTRRGIPCGNVGFVWRIKMRDPEIDYLREKIYELEDAIRNHRDQKGDDRCFLDDMELYKVLGDKVPFDNRLPPKCDFLESCKRFWEQRQYPPEKDHISLPDDMTIAQLTEEVKRLREKRIEAQDIMEDMISFAGEPMLKCKERWENAVARAVEMRGK